MERTLSRCSAPKRSGPDRLCIRAAVSKTEAQSYGLGPWSAACRKGDDTARDRRSIEILIPDTYITFSPRRGSVVARTRLHKCLRACAFVPAVRVRPFFNPLNDGSSGHRPIRSTIYLHSAAQRRVVHHQPLQAFGLQPSRTHVVRVIKCRGDQFGLSAPNSMNTLEKLLRMKSSRDRLEPPKSSACAEFCEIPFIRKLPFA